MLLAENRPFKTALVNPEVVFQVAVTVAVEPRGHATRGSAPQSPNTTGPVESVMLESMWICTPVRALVNPVAAMVMETEVGESCVKVTLADPEGDPTLDTGNSESALAVQMMVPKAGLTLARSSPVGLFSV